jgi:hypothetical protein
MRKSIAAVMAVVLVFPLVLATLLSFSIITWALDRSFYLEIVSDERIYEPMLSDTAWDEKQVFDDLDRIGELDGIPAGALARALREIVTPHYLRSQAVRLVNGIFDTIEGRSSVTELSIELTPLKERLRGEAGERFARVLVESLPACSEGQEPLAPGGSLPRCLPPGISDDEAAQLILTGLPEFLKRLPETYPLPPESIRVDYQRANTLWLGFIGKGRLIWASVILGLIAAGFWIGAAFVAGENRREVVQWLGWPLLAPALVILAAGIALRIVAGWPWADIAPMNWIGADFWHGAEIAGVIATVVKEAVKTAARGFLTTSGIVVGISLGLIIWSYSIQAEDE